MNDEQEWQDAYESLLKENKELKKALDKACRELAKLDLTECKWTVKKWKDYLINGRGY